VILSVFFVICQFTTYFASEIAMALFRFFVCHVVHIDAKKCASVETRARGMMGD